MKTPEEIKKGLECCFLECDDTSLIDHCKACPFQPNGVCFRALIKDSLTYIQRLEAQVPKWISVEERLPKRNACVVVTDGKHTWDYGQFNGLAFCFNNENPNPRKWNWKKHAVRHVEWWMPKETALPESPKETEHD